MGKTNFFRKLVCVTTAAATLTAPLLACGDDDELTSVKVTDAEWEERSLATVTCKNYTDTTTFSNHEMLCTHIVKFDIDNNIIYAFCENTTFYAYYFVYLHENSEDHYWYISVCYDGNTLKADSSYERSRVNRLKRIAMCPDESYTSINTAMFAAELYDEKNSFTFNNNGHYYERTGDLYYNKVYFSSQYIFQTYVKSPAVTAHTKCSDFGTTKVKVPANVKALAEEYKSTHEPPVDEE